MIIHPKHLDEDPSLLLSPCELYFCPGLPNVKECTVIPIPIAPTVAMASEESANKNNYNDEP